MSNLVNKESFDKYEDSILEKLNWAFPIEKIALGNSIPYEAVDREFSEEVKSFFTGKSWKDFNLSNFDKYFLDEKLNAFLFLGWGAKKILLPSVISMGMEAYKNSDIFLEASEFLIMNPHCSDDVSSNYIEWVNSFSKIQKIIVLDYIFLMRSDIDSRYYGTIFQGDYSHWIP